MKEHFYTNRDFGDEHIDKNDVFNPMMEPQIANIKEPLLDEEAFQESLYIPDEVVTPFLETWGRKLNNLMNEQRALERFNQEVELKEGKTYLLNYQPEANPLAVNEMTLTTKTPLQVGYMALSAYMDMVEQGEFGKLLANAVVAENKAFANEQGTPRLQS